MLIDKGTTFWRERNQLSKTLDDEEDSVLLIMLWDGIDETKGAFGNDHELDV